eukprot:2399818-Pyramimonas_sp.AAC.1
MRRIICVFVFHPTYRPTLPLTHTRFVSQVTKIETGEVKIAHDDFSVENSVFAPRVEESDAKAGLDTTEAAEMAVARIWEVVRKRDSLLSAVRPPVGMPVGIPVVIPVV